MAAGDMATLSQVKQWLNVTSTNDDALLSRLITAASRFILNYIGCTNLDVHTVNEVRNGNGNAVMVLREFPALSIQSLSINGSAVTAQTDAPFGYGYLLDAWDGQDTPSAQQLSVFCSLFYRGQRNVSVSYLAGYKVSGESWTVPSASAYEVTVERPWLSDQGVEYANGTSLVKVNSAPSTGQYSVSNGVYSFAAGDAGVIVLISYGYVPEDLQNAVIELVGERYRTRDRIGQVSKSLGGQETISFSQRDMNAFVADVLDRFRRVAPV